MSQFAVQITSAVSDLVAVIKNSVEDLIALESVYAFVILGRREFGIEYQNDEGKFMTYETTEQLELL